MIEGARATVRERNSACTFLQRDILRRRVPGRHDTVVLLGNTLAHFTPTQFTNILDNVAGGLRRGAFLIVSYRDLVEQLLRGQWRIGRTYRRKLARGTINVTSVGADLSRGTLQVRLNASWFRNPTRSTHAICSPFILNPLVALFGWNLVHRRRRGDQC